MAVCCRLIPKFYFYSIVVDSPRSNAEEQEAESGSEIGVFLKNRIGIGFKILERVGIGTRLERSPALVRINELTHPSLRLFQHWVLAI